MGSAKVANELAQWIRSGQATVGSYLPPTRQLATKFGVSLHTVGVALKQLQTQNLVECLPRQGAKVVSRTLQSAAPTQIKQIAVFVVNERDWLMAPHVTAEWGWQVIRSFERELFGAGYSLLSMSASQPLESDEITLEQRLDRLGPTLCGAICFAHSETMRTIDALQKRDVPWVTIGRPHRQMRQNYVAADNLDGGRKVGRLFAACGFERVLLLPSQTIVRPNDVDKLTGLFQGYIESGASTAGLKIIPCGSVGEMDAYQTTRAVLKEGFRPQAVFATGDFLAAGAMHALRDAAMRVPEDVSVVGATGLDASAHMDPPLSVLAQPTEQIGHAAGQILRQMITEGTRRYTPRLFDCSLILRNSVNVSEEIRCKLADEALSEKADPATITDAGSA